MAKFEIVLKDPVKLGVPPIEVEVSRILGKITNYSSGTNPKGGEIEKEAIPNVLCIEWERIYVADGGAMGKWLSKEDLSLGIPLFYVPLGNVRCFVEKA